MVAAPSTNAAASTPPEGEIAGSLGALLPRGWSDLARQFAIWLGFVLLYQVARGLADRGPAEAFRNARRVIRLEQHLGGLIDLDVQQFVLERGAGPGAGARERVLVVSAPRPYDVE